MLLVLADGYSARQGALRSAWLAHALFERRESPFQIVSTTGQRSRNHWVFRKLGIRSPGQSFLLGDVHIQNIDDATDVGDQPVGLLSFDDRVFHSGNPMN